MVSPSVDAVDIDLKTGTTLGFYTYGRDEPNVLLVAGMSGLSATDVYASYLIMRELRSQERIDGSVTVLPVANPLAFRLGAAVSPLDSRDLDSTFPGDERGTVTERTAREIWRRAMSARYIIQLETDTLSCVSHVVALHRDYIHVRNLATQVALPLVVQSPGTRGALSVEAAHEGIAALTIVMRGGRGEVDPQAAVEVKEAVLNLLRVVNVVSGEPMEVSNTLMGRAQKVNVSEEGFFVPLINLGEVVSQNEPLGAIQDKSPVVTTQEGAVVALSRMTYVFEGDVVARVAAPLAERTPIRDRDEESAPRRKW